MGCLLATAFFLMFVEASHLIGARWGEESQMTWRFGSMALAGYMVGLISSLLGDHFHHYIESGKETGKPAAPGAEFRGRFCLTSTPRDALSSTRVEEQPSALLSRSG